MDEESNLEDDRAIELTSIEAIYPEINLDPARPFHATLDIPVTPSTPFKVIFRAAAADDTVSLNAALSALAVEDSKKNEGITKLENGEATPLAKNTVEVHQTHSLDHLPPLTLDVTLEDGYPTENAPTIKLSSDPLWLPESVVTSLVKAAERLWEENGRNMVVFDYISYLEESGRTVFGLATGDDAGVEMPANLEIALLDYDIMEKRRQFEKGTYDCGVCLEPKKGSACHKLMHCGHIFCVACLQDFFGACITEGDVDNVKCLNPECGKKKESNTSTTAKRHRHERTLNPSELLQIPIAEELVQRYVHLKRKKAIESDKNTVYCPRQWCQGAARSKKHPKPEEMFSDAASVSEDEEAEADTADTDGGALPPMAERLSVCEDCNYAFCSVCKKGWHGELTHCFPRNQAEPTEEELATEKYFKMHTTPCPTCSAPSQKSHGCNHMICFKCRTHFCYLCSSYLMPDNPYQHFNNPKSSCHMRLWELEGGDGDGEEVGQGYGGGGDFHHPGIPDGVEHEHDFEDANDLAEFIVADAHAVAVAGDAESDTDEERFVGGRQRRGVAPPPAPAPPRRPNDRDRRVPPAAERDGQPVVQGLQRFLQLVMNDREDEWDSDELDEDIDGEGWGGLE